MIEWPYVEVDTTFIVSSPRCIDLLWRERKEFVKQLRSLHGVRIKKKVKFVKERGLSDVFVYVVDDGGVRVIVDMEWGEEKVSKSKKDFDFEKYDA